jgi:hypothetical protein
MTYSVETLHGYRKGDYCLQDPSGKLHIPRGPTLESESEAIECLKEQRAENRGA